MNELANDNINRIELFGFNKNMLNLNEKVKSFYGVEVNLQD